MGSIIYNKLPDHLKEIDSFKVFKKKIKIVFAFSHFLFSGRIFILMIVLL